MNQEPDVSSEFEIDPALMGEEFNCVRPKRFPYGIVINAEIAGLFIPEKSLAKAGWFGTPEIVEKDLSGGVAAFSISDLIFAKRGQTQCQAADSGTLTCFQKQHKAATRLQWGLRIKK